MSTGYFDPRTSAHNPHQYQSLDTDIASEKSLNYDEYCYSSPGLRYWANTDSLHPNINLQHVSNLNNTTFEHSYYEGLPLPQDWAFLTKNNKSHLIINNDDEDDDVDDYNDNNNDGDYHYTFNSTCSDSINYNANENYNFNSSDPKTISLYDMNNDYTYDSSFLTQNLSSPALTTQDKPPFFSSQSRKSSYSYGQSQYDQSSCLSFDEERADVSPGYEFNSRNSSICTIDTNGNDKRKKIHDSRLSLAQLSVVLGLNNDIGETIEREKIILNIFKDELNFPLGEKTWVRDTPAKDRVELINNLFSIAESRYNFGYSKDIYSIIVRRASYSLMQGRLRRERRFKKKYQTSLFKSN